MMTTTEKLANPPAIDDALDRLHKRWARCRDEMLMEGVDPVLCIEAMLTVATAGMIVVQGRTRTAHAIGTAYASIRQADVADSSAPRH